VVPGIVDAHPGRDAVGRQFIVAGRHLAAEINIQLQINCLVLSLSSPGVGACRPHVRRRVNEATAAAVDIWIAD